jgi:NAD(P)-dependent dehydrogenase (short-subunit alcohol dehydrogenase family)
MGDRLKGKVAIVTGAGRGIGRGEALALVSEGAKVVVNDFGGGPDGTGATKSPADDVVAEIKKMGGQAAANHDSVATAQGGENIVKTAVSTFGRLDILVNNAGILRDRMIFNMSDEDWDIVMKVHLYGHFFTTRSACVLFRQQRGGRIINTSSEAGFGVSFGQSNYGAAKEGVIGFTRNVARDMGRYGVTCNAIRPAAGTRLTLSDDVVKSWEKAGMGESYVKMMGQMVPEDIAPLVVWLASDDAANVTARTFQVQSGKISLYSEPVEQKTLIKVGRWTIDELFAFMPTTLAAGLVNPFFKKE